MAITIRPAAQADLPALLSLYRQLHPADPHLPAETATRVWRDVAAQPGRTILVADNGDAVAGTVDCAILANLTRGARPFLLIENLVVGIAHRRRGVGRRLLGAAVDMAREAGCYKAQLLSRDSRVEAHAFYFSCGFQPVARGYRLYL